MNLDSNLSIRFARAQEAPILIELLTRQHGLLYPHRYFYEAAFIADAIKTAQLFFAVAEDKGGKIVGMICADARQARDGLLTFSLLTVLPAYRGRRIGPKMQDFLDETLDFSQYAYTRMYCLTMDTVSQKGTEKRGYTPTALLPNRYFLDGSAANLAGRTPPMKRSHLLMCKASAHADAGTLYCPEGLRNFVAAVYGGMGVAFGFAECDSDAAAPSARPTSFSAVQHDRHSYCEIQIAGAGADLAGLLRDCARRYDACDFQSYSVMLDMAHESCPFACRVLREQGYAFTGLSPVAGRGACAVFSRSPSLPQNRESFALLPSFLAMIEKLKQ
ncbi:MAG: hypothetical protein LBB57_02410 [Clostridiales Family XIII bacterium]|jgi:ribosomal protein S18 acetylase RimI-like enzyme|nr:hypothetical protein [Clostridiales Family XIII bacterium]